MGGEAWSCFARLPSGLIDPGSAALTLNWLRPRPTHAGFRLARDEVDDGRYERNLRLRRVSIFSGVLLAAGIGALTAFDRVYGLNFLEHERNLFVAVWAGVAGVSAALLLAGLCSYAILRYRRAEARRMAFHSARVEFEHVDAWRRLRCEPRFWAETLDDSGFEFEVAELLAGHFGTGQVMLTRATNDYGVDILVCGHHGRVVAQCKPWKERKVGAAQVRELAGAKAFFGADIAVLVSLENAADDSEQCSDYAQSLKLDLWDLGRIVAVASEMREAN